ncbi:MAG: flagellar hook-associated protein FlgL [Actinobacteria bacterium]|nr:flagellar hook-associated protein FlgL [Actinomycetota bacterium]OJU79948.1 MAG: flagellar hook-associated protein 3 [Solirubrobacterales bacterium 70-9]
MPLRVTETMTSRLILTDLDAARTKMAQTQREISSGKRITRPSDDPFGTGRALQLGGELEGLRQFKSNVDDGTGWVTASEAALTRITQTVQRARELLVQGGNDSNGQVAREGIAAEIEALIEDVKQEANVTYGGRFIFSGTETDTRPYELGAVDAYAGNEGTVARVIGRGVSLQINVNVKELLGEGQAAGDDKLLDVLRDAAENLRGGTVADSEAVRGTDLSRLDANLDELTRVRAVVGATTDRLTTAGTRLEELEESGLKQLSDVRDADLPEALVNFSTQQAAYETALRAGAQIVQPSLLDFLR